MADLKSNVSRMIQAGVPEEEIGAYIQKYSGAEISQGERPIPYGHDSVDLDTSTLLKSAFTDKPESRLQFIADQLGVSPDQIGKQGDDLVYFDPQRRILNRIAPASVLREAGVSLIGKAPTIAGAISGAVKGSRVSPFWGTLAGGVLGAGAGELGRQGLGAALGEEKTPAHVAKEVGKEMAYEVPGSLLGGAMLRGGTNRLAKELQRDASKLDAGDMARISGLEEKYGVPLTVAERTKLPSMVNEQKRLLNVPGGGDILSPFLDERAQKIYTALDDYMRGVSSQASPYEANMAFRNAAADTLESANSARRSATKPLYDAVSESGAMVDVSPVLDSLKAMDGTASPDALNRINRIIKRRLPKGGSEIEIATLDSLKKELDDLVGVASRKGQSNLANDLKRIGSGVTKTLREMGDEAFPGYAQAREAHRTFKDVSGLSVDEMNRGVIGDIARAKKDIGGGANNAAGMLFGSGSSPEVVLKARLTVGRQNPEAWNGLLRAELQNTLSKIKDPATGGLHRNVGGMFRKMTLGDPRKASMLKAAMSKQQFDTFREIGELLELTGRASGKESGTHWLMAADKGIAQGVASSKASRVAEAVTSLGRSEAKRAAAHSQGTQIDQFNESLATAIIHPDGLKRIRQLKLMTKNEKAMRVAVPMFINDMLGEGAGAAFGGDIPVRSGSDYLKYVQENY